VEQVTALELRKNLAEISRQVRDDDLKAKVLVVHGEPNMGLVSPGWAEVIDKVADVKVSVEMNQDLARILHAQAAALAGSTEPVRLRELIDRFVDQAVIFSKFKELNKTLPPQA
jgi:hypothetical protein